MNMDGTDRITPVVPTSLDVDPDEESDFRVEVNGVSPNTTPGAVRQFFSSPQRSGGGTVREMEQFPGGRYRVTFQSREVADRVMANSLLLLDGQKLEVSKSCISNQTVDDSGIDLSMDESKNLPDPEDTHHQGSAPVSVIIQDVDHHKAQFLKTVPNLLKSLSATVDWDHQGESELRVEYSGPPMGPPGMDNSPGVDHRDKGLLLITSRAEENEAWRQRVQESIQNILEDVKVERRDCLKSCWRDVCEVVARLRRRHNTVAIIECAEEVSVLVVGREIAAQEVFQELHAACGEIERKLEHTQDSIELSDTEGKCLQIANIVQKMRRKYQHVRITLDEEMLELDGPAVDLQNIRNDVNLFLRKIQRRSFPLSTGRIEIFKMLRRQSRNEFDDDITKLNLLILINGTNIMVHGLEDDLDSFEEMLETTVKEVAIKVPKEEQGALKEEIWKEFTSHAFIKYTGLVHFEVTETDLDSSKVESKVNIAGLSSDINCMVEDVKKHIETKAMIDIPIPMDFTEAKAVLKWMRLEERYPTVKVVEDDEGPKVKVKVKVRSKDYAEIYQKVDSFVRSSETRNLKLRKGHVKLFILLRNQGNNLLSKLSRLLKVIVIKEKPNLVLFGIKSDLDKFEKILAGTIKDAAIQISTEERAALDETIWKNFETGIILKYNGIVDISLATDGSLLQIVTASDHLKDLVTEVKGHLQRNAVRKITVNLDPLETKKILEWTKMEEMYPALKVSMLGTVMQMTGPTEHSILASTQMQAFFTSVTRKNVTFSAEKVQVLNALLGQPNCRLGDQISKLLIKWHLEGNTALLFGVAADVQIFEDLLAENIKETIIELSEEEKVGFEGHSLDLGSDIDPDRFFQSLFTKYWAVVHSDVTADSKRSLKIAAPSCNFDDVINTVKSYVQNNALLKITPPELETHQVEAILNWMKLKQRYPQYGIFQADNEILLMGPTEETSEIQEEVDSFLEGMSEETLDLPPGVLKIFSMLHRDEAHPMNRDIDNFRLMLTLGGETGLKLFGVTEDVASFGEDIIEKYVSVETIEITEEQQPGFADLLDSPTWEQCLNHIHVNYSGFVHLEPEVDDNALTLTLVAPSEDFEAIRQEVMEVIDKNSVKAISVDLDPDFIQMFLKWSEVEDRFQGHLKVKILDGVVTLTGGFDTIHQAELELKEFVKRMDMRNLALSKGTVKVFEMLQNQPNSKLSKSIGKLKINTSIDNGEKITAFGVKEDLDAFEEIIIQNIKEGTVILSQEDLTAIEDSSWEELYAAILVRCCGILHIDLKEEEMVLNIATDTSRFYEILNEITKYIKKNALRETTVELGPNETKLVQRYMREDLLDIADWLRYRLSFTPVEGVGFSITGTEDGMGFARRRFERLTRRIVTARLSLEAPGMLYYFNRGVGRCFIRKVEQRHQAVVEVWGQEPPQALDLLAENDENESDKDSQTGSSFEDLQPTPPAAVDVGGEVQIGSITLQVVPAGGQRETLDGVISLSNAKVKVTSGENSQQLQNVKPLVPTSKNFEIEVACDKEEWKSGLLEGLTRAEEAKWNSLLISADKNEALPRPSPEQLITATVGALAEFCRRKEGEHPTLCLVRIEVHLRYMLPLYLATLEAVTSQEGDVINGMVTSPFSYLENQHDDYIASKLNSKLELTIVGMSKKGVNGVKKAIKKCCRQETAEACVSGLGYSDTIQNLSQDQMEALKITVQRFGVTPTVVSSSGECAQIRLQGLHHDVIRAELRVKELLNVIQYDTTQRHEAVIAQQLHDVTVEDNLETAGQATCSEVDDLITL